MVIVDRGIFFWISNDVHMQFFHPSVGLPTMHLLFCATALCSISSFCHSLIIVHACFHSCSQYLIANQQPWCVQYLFSYGLRMWSAGLCSSFLGMYFILHHNPTGYCIPIVRKSSNHALCFRGFSCVLSLFTVGQTASMVTQHSTLLYHFQMPF